MDIKISGWFFICDLIIKLWARSKDSQSNFLFKTYQSPKKCFVKSGVNLIDGLRKKYTQVVSLFCTLGICTRKRFS